MIKLCFSTLGCPRWDFNEVFATAHDLGLKGIEIRGIGDELYAPDISDFRPQNIDKTIARLKEADMSIPVLTTNSALGDPSRAQTDYNQAREYVDLAARLETPYIRVMPTGKPEPEDCDYELLKSLYGKLCDYAAPRGVVPLMETNGILADSAKMAEFMADFAGKGGVLWDIHHPFRYFGEGPEYTVKNIGPLVKHVHVKDSKLENGVVCYRMMGYGDVPVLESLRELKKLDYDGFVSFEWAKRWNPDLQEPGIVFAHFVDYMKYLLRQI